MVQTVNQQGEALEKEIKVNKGWRDFKKQATVALKSQDKMNGVGVETLRFSQDG